DAKRSAPGVRARCLQERIDRQESGSRPAADGIARRPGRDLEGAVARTAHAGAESQAAAARSIAGPAARLAAGVVARVAWVRPRLAAAGRRLAGRPLDGLAGAPGLGLHRCRPALRPVHALLVRDGRRATSPYYAAVLAAAGAAGQSTVAAVLLHQPKHH